MSGKTDRDFIRTFAKVIIVLSVMVVAFAIIGVAAGWGIEDHPQLREERVQSRVQPVAQVVTSAQAAAMQKTQAKAAASKPQLSGEQVVAQVCSACHKTGLLSAPKIGNATDWGNRFKTQGGLDGLVKHAIHGLNMMPPRGGDAALSDQEIHDAVKYMLSKAGITG